MNTEMLKDRQEDFRKIHPCKTCSNILTRVCFDDCFFKLDYRHYSQRPGTDIKELPAFPFEQVRESDPNMRLVVIEIYLKTITDYLQHPEDYEINRRAYNYDNDYSI